MITELLLNNPEYKEFMTEYYRFVLFILNDMDRNEINASGICFHEDSILYIKRDEFIQLLQETFPDFDIIFRSYTEDNTLEHLEYSIVVDWDDYNWDNY
jgi:hypothetical protein